MTRMASEEIHDRRRMFELFSTLKVQPPNLESISDRCDSIGTIRLA
jgi:hypothetical protein